MHYDENQGRSYSQVAEEVAAAAVASLQQALVTPRLGCAKEVSGDALSGGEGTTGASGCRETKTEQQQDAQNQQQQQDAQSQQQQQDARDQQQQPVVLRLECVTVPGCVEVILWGWTAIEISRAVELQGESGVIHVAGSSGACISTYCERRGLTVQCTMLISL